MNFNIRKSCLWATLAAALIIGAVAAPVFAQNPNDPLPGTRADQREDRQDARQLKSVIQGDRQRLRSDVNQFGKRSPQARADRQQLRQDRERMNRLRRDRQGDRHIRNGNGGR